MQNRKSLIALTIACTLSITAFAEGSPAQELQSIGERTAVLEARLKELELENKLLQQNNDIAARGAAAKRAVNSIDADSDYGTPTVAQVEGIKGALEAVLVYRGNVRQRVHEGDSVFGAVVKKIAINEVVLVDVKTRRLTRLQFSSAPVTREAGTQIGQMGGPLPVGIPPSVPGSPVGSGAMR